MSNNSNVLSFCRKEVVFMSVNKRKLLVVSGIAISIALIGAIVFVSSQYFSPIVLDRNSDGRPVVVRIGCVVRFESVVW